MMKNQLRVYKTKLIIHSNQVNAVKSEKHRSKKWWNKVNNMTGRIANILPISSIIDPDVINTYFQSINTDPEYIAPQLQSMPKDTRIPSLSIDMVYNFLRKLNIHVQYGRIYSIRNLIRTSNSTAFV